MIQKDTTEEVIKLMEVEDDQKQLLTVRIKKCACQRKLQPRIRRNSKKTQALYDLVTGRKTPIFKHSKKKLKL